MAKGMLRALTLHRFPPFLTHLQPPLPFKLAIPCSITSHLAGYARNRLKKDGERPEKREGARCPRWEGADGEGRLDAGDLPKDIPVTRHCKPQLSQKHSFSQALLSGKQDLEAEDKNPVPNPSSKLGVTSAQLKWEKFEGRCWR